MPHDPAGSRRSAAAPAAEDPYRKKTIEVDVSWLQADLAGADRPTPQPPPLADAGARHHTIEVAPEWLQVEPAAAEAPPASRPARKLPPPIPREETPWCSAVRAPRSSRRR